MRTLLRLGAIIAAMLVPWGSIAPSWLPDASGSAITPVQPQPTRGLAARLNPALGILPVAADGSTEIDVTAGGQRVVCENGACRLVDESPAAATAQQGIGPTRPIALKKRLQSLGASDVLVESAAGCESRVACCVPITPGSKVLKCFKATGANEAEALGMVVERIEAWLQDR